MDRKNINWLGSLKVEKYNIGKCQIAQIKPIIMLPLYIDSLVEMFLNKKPLHPSSSVKENMNAGIKFINKNAGLIMNSALLIKIEYTIDGMSQIKGKLIDTKTSLKLDIADLESISNPLLFLLKNLRPSFFLNKIEHITADNPGPNCPKYQNNSSGLS